MLTLSIGAWMKLRYLRHTDAPSLSISTIEDRFFRAICAQWGAGVLSTHLRLDKETLEYASWVLDPKSGMLENALEGVGVDVTSVLSEAGDSVEERAAALAPIVCRPGLVQTRCAGALASALQSLAVENAESDIASGLDKIVETYGLSADECALAFFLASISAWPQLERYFDSHLECDRPSGRKYLSAALGMNQARLRAAITGRLSGIGILDTSHTWLSMDSEYEPLFMNPAESDLLSDLHRPVPSADLALDDLDLDMADVTVVRTLLTAPGDRSAHILVHGEPGTGKTSFVRSLIHENGLDGLEVMGRTDGTVKQRHGALEACLHMSSDRPGRVVVIDEADKLLNTGFSWSNHGETSDKARMNDVLDRPGLRCIWIVNTTDDIDPAVRRRMSFALEMPAADQRSRRIALESTVRRCRIKRHFSDHDLRTISRDYPVSPALYKAAADTAMLTSSNGDDCRATFRRTLDSHLKLAGIRTPSTHGDEFIACGVHTTPALDDVIGRARAYDARWRALCSGQSLPSLNLLFHGAPGTGKSHSARHLAELVDRPVMVRRSSDLLNPYIGMTERGVAEAFAEARRAGAVLVIDEIDVFIFDRTKAVRTWEASLVSEFLVQLEQGPGMVIGTTNMSDVIDAAAKRRFAGRVSFDYLPSRTFLETYKRMLGSLASGRLSAGNARRLLGIRNGTAAGLASVRRMLEMTHERGIVHGRIIDEVVREFEDLPEVDRERRVVGFGGGA